MHELYVIFCFPPGAAAAAAPVGDEPNFRSCTASLWDSLISSLVSNTFAIPVRIKEKKN